METLLSKVLAKDIKVGMRVMELRSSRKGTVVKIAWSHREIDWDVTIAWDDGKQTVMWLSWCDRFVLSD